MNINIIIRDDTNLITQLKSVKYKPKKINSLDVLANNLMKMYADDGKWCDCEYDIECKKKYIYYLACKKKKFKLDVDFEQLTFDKYYEVTDRALTINAIIYEGGIGGGGGLFDFLDKFFLIFEFLKIVFTLITAFFVYLFPFHYIKKNYGYGRHFILDIIISNDAWDYGFFCLDRIQFNKLLERAVMHKFGYRLKNKKWILKKYNLSNYNYFDKYSQY